VRAGIGNLLLLLLLLQLNGLMKILRRFAVALDPGFTDCSIAVRVRREL